MFIVTHRKIFIGISIALVALSLAALFIFGLRVGIDFKGGALTEVNYSTGRPAQADVNPSLEALGLGSILLQPTGDAGYIVKSRDLSDPEHKLLLEALSERGAVPLT